MSPSGRLRRTAVAGGSAKTTVSAGLALLAFTKRQHPQPTTPDLRSCKLQTLLRRGMLSVDHTCFLAVTSPSSHWPNVFLQTTRQVMSTRGWNSVPYNSAHLAVIRPMLSILAFTNINDVCLAATREFSLREMLREMLTFSE